MEISSCSVDFAHGADDGQRVQDDGRHSEVMIMITMVTLTAMIAMIDDWMIALIAMIALIDLGLEDCDDDHLFVQGWQVQAAQSLARN